VVIAWADALARTAVREGRAEPSGFLGLVEDRLELGGGAL
jgi:hypothetical protein